MKRILAILLALAMVFCFAACGEKKETGNEPQTPVKDSIVIGCEQEPYSLSPIESTGAPSARIRRLICQGLFEIDEKGNYIPLLATEWTWKDDVTLEFKLREGVKFTDGKEFKAADVAWSMKNALGRGGIFDNYVKDTTIVDDHTIDINFLAPNSVCFDFFTSQHFPIYNEEAYAADGNEFAYNLIGTGPYKLVKWNTGESLTMEANPDYWGEAPAIKNVTFKFITEESQRTMEMETGGTDIDVQVDAGNFSYFQDETKFKMASAADPFLRELFFNMSPAKNSPVCDLRVRQAIAYAFDAAAVQSSLKNGAGSTPTTNINPLYASIYEPGKEILFKYDVDKAKALLKEAGYETGLKLVVLDDATEDYKNFSEMLMGALDAVGVEVEMLTRDYTTWYDTVCKKEEWDLCWFSLGDATSPVYAFNHFLGDGTRIASPDYTSWRNDTFLDALVEASVCNDPVRYKELFQIMNQCMIDDLPMYSFYVQESTAVYGADLNGFEFRNGLLNIEEISFK